MSRKGRAELDRAKDFQQMSLVFVIILFLGTTSTLLGANAILSWNPNTDSVAGYKVYYGTASQTYGPPTDVGNQVTYTVTGLTTGTYYFAVTAYNSQGIESPFSNEVSLTIVPVDTIPPTVPTNVAASVVSSSQINLTWTASTDNVGVTGYKIFMNGTQIGTPTTTSYQDTGLTPSTSYSYTISAFDAAGNNSAQSTAITATTQAVPDTTPPTVPTNVAASVVSSSQINLTWTASTDNVGVAGYKIYQNGAQIGTSAATTYQVIGLTVATTYSFTVSAYDAAGNNSAQSTAVTATTTAATPPVISAITATSITSSGATITWTTNVGSDSQVDYGLTTAYGSSTTLNSSLVTSHSQAISGLAASSLYHYRVKSRDGSGNLATSSDFTFTTLASTSSTCTPANIRCVSATPGPNQKYATIQAAADASQPGDTVLVFDGNYTGFELLTSGTQASPLTIKAAGSNAVINVSGTEGDGIRLQNVSYVTVDGFQIQNPLQRCINVRGGTPASPVQGLVIKNNKCSNSTLEGFYFGAFNGSTVSSNTIINAGNGSTSGTAHGIYLSNAGSKNTTLQGNVISGSAGDGIHVSADAVAGGDGLITGLLLNGNTVSGSTGHGLSLDGVQNSTIENNLVYGNTGSALRGFKTNGAQGPRNLSIINNTLVVANNGNFSILLSQDSGGHTIFNNILLSTSGSGGSVAVGNVGFVSNNNAVVNSFSLDSGTTLISLTAWQSAGYEGGSFVSTSSALFVNPTSNDYHLRSGSPAIDAGRSSFAGVSAPSIDLEGNIRPQGTGYDLGAYEYVGGSSGGTPPVISAVTAAALTTTGATISWTTDRNTDTQIEFGTTTAYGTLTTLNSNLSTSHTQGMIPLTANTVYHYRVRSRDASGNLAVSGDFTLTTPAAASTSHCDIRGDGNVNVAAIQLMINTILSGVYSANMDLNRDGRLDVSDLQILNNVVLGTASCPL